MISKSRNISIKDKGDETELEPLNPPVPNETTNRATARDVEDDIAGADIGNDLETS